MRKVIDMTFGEKLKTLRQQKSMSQFKLSLKTEIPQCLISNYESGRTQPTLGNLEVLCAALDVSATELVGF
jgi:transcriptional regulator with XRE-family HTH domain